MKNFKDMNKEEIEQMLQEKVARWKQQLSQKEVLVCECGKRIKINSKAREVKCFKCNHYHIKINKKWERQPFVIQRDDMTIKDFMPEKMKAIIMG